MKLRPTKGLWGLLAVLALSLAPAALDAGPSGWLPFLTLLCSAALSLLHLLLVKDRVRCRAVPGRDVLVRGDEIPLRAEVENASLLPAVGLRAELFLADAAGLDRQTFPLQMALAPRERRSFTADAAFAHVGVYEAGLRRVVLTDLFGVFQAVSRAEDRRRLDVQPRLAEVRQLPVSDRLAVEDHRSRAVSPLSGMDYVGVREYAYGDPIKTIQWKLSAHAGSLMTKQLESCASSGAVIVMDFAIPEGGPEERLNLCDAVAEAGASAGDWCVRSGMDCALLLPGEDGAFRRCVPASFRDLRPWLGGMRPREADERGRLAQALRRECGESAGNILVCAAELTEDTLAALLQLKRARKHPALLLLVPERPDAARQRALTARLAQLEYAGIPCRTGRSAGEVTA